MNAMYDRYPPVPPPPHRDWHDHETPEYRWRYANERCITRAQRDWDVYSAVVVMLNEYGSRLTKAFAGMDAECSQVDAEEKTALNNWTKQTFEEAKVERDPSGCFTSSGGSGGPSGSGATAGSSGSSGSNGAILSAVSSASGTQRKEVEDFGSTATAPVLASGARPGKSAGGGTSSAPGDASSKEYQGLKDDVADHGQTIPDESALQSSSRAERRNAFEDLLRVADALEGKNPFLARKLRERGKEAVSPSYSVTNDHTERKSRAMIERYQKGELNIRQFDDLSVNEKLSVLLVLHNEDSLTNEKDALFSRLADSIQYSKEVRIEYVNYIKGDYNVLQEQRRLLMPREYERAAAHKIDGLAKAFAGNSSFQADDANWTNMDRKEKQAALSHWLEFIRKELNLEGQYSFLWRPGEGTMHVIPLLDNEESDRRDIKLSAENTIIVPENALAEMESASLQKALFRVVHEAMHLYEVETMNKVLKNKDATMEEKLYALKIAGSILRASPDNPVKYNSYIPDSSAIYFSELFRATLLLDMSLVEAKQQSQKLWRQQ